MFVCEASTFEPRTVRHLRGHSARLWFTDPARRDSI